MLENAERDGYAHVISWMPDGKSFKIHVDGSLDEADEKAIVEILKRTFNQTRFKSFLRQLQLYGFERTYKGPHRGECKHQLFVRGRKDLLHKKSIDDFQRTANSTSNRSPKNVRKLFEPPMPEAALSSTTPEAVTSSFTPLNYSPNNMCSLPMGGCNYLQTSIIPTRLTNLILPDSDCSVQDSQAEYDEDDLSLAMRNPLAPANPLFDMANLKSIDVVRDIYNDDDVISIDSGENIPCWTGMELDILKRAL